MRIVRERRLRRRVWVTSAVLTAVALAPGPSAAAGGEAPQPGDVTTQALARPQLAPAPLVTCLLEPSGGRRPLSCSVGRGPVPMPEVVPSGRRPVPMPHVLPAEPGPVPMPMTAHRPVRTAAP